MSNLHLKYQMFGQRSSGKLLRFLAVSMFVVPAVLLMTACGGSAGGGSGEEETPGTLPSEEIEQFKECVDLAQSDQEPAEYVIAIIMDNSGSMCDIHDEFSDKLSGLFAGLPTGGAAVRIGVITTDMDNAGHKGELHTSRTNNNQWVDFDFKNLEDSTQAVRDIIDNIGKTSSSINTCDGSGSERGLDASYTGLTLMTRPGGENDGFFDGKEDAALIVVYISDEFDNSRDSGMLPSYPSDHLAAFDAGVAEGYFASHTHIAVAHNEAVPNICSDSTDSYFDGYESFVDDDYFICDDWDDTFASLNDTVFNPELCATLGKGLIASTIEAQLADGTPVTEYTYNQETGLICFAPGDPGTNEGDVTTFCGLPLTGEE